MSYLLAYKARSSVLPREAHSQSVGKPNQKIIIDNAVR